MKGNIRLIIFSVLVLLLFVVLMLISTYFAWAKAITLLAFIILFLISSYAMTQITLYEKKRKREKQDAEKN
ncbi:protease HtpX homolog [Weissella oryzae SG25]|uniref:Protease HtpX homolog n=1 Tax=Weissella oryzae (strain DSM 25784 / JCM 18191 / LMG 30913 / SG25) TaxID=1329250 RepID=A0A069CTX8_WEIOS|nr:hypothetical protein [Weissella oryzae]GAK30688.1 protease HtpX homolog [Weissella oryzae SG25]